MLLSLWKLHWKSSRMWKTECWQEQYLKVHPAEAKFVSRVLPHLSLPLWLVRMIPEEVSSSMRTKEVQEITLTIEFDFGWRVSTLLQPLRTNADCFSS